MGMANEGAPSFPCPGLCLGVCPGLWRCRPTERRHIGRCEGTVWRIGRDACPSQCECSRVRVLGLRSGDKRLLGAPSGDESLARHHATLHEERTRVSLPTGAGKYAAVYLPLATPREETLTESPHGHSADAKERMSSCSHRGELVPPFGRRMALDLLPGARYGTGQGDRLDTRADPAMTSSQAGRPRSIPLT
jgi:hypothetical protein